MTTKAQTPTLTTDDIEAGLDHPDFGGFGYLGERSRQGRAAQDRGDAVVLREANARGWDREQLFAWTNSRDGRWFGDNAFGGWDDADLDRHTASYFRGW